MASNPLPEVIAEAVASLTFEQKREILGEAVRIDDTLCLREVRSPARRCALQRRGILVDRMYSTILTPLGLAVRETLQARTALTKKDETR